MQLLENGTHENDQCPFQDGISEKEKGLEVKIENRQTECREIDVNLTGIAFMNLGDRSNDRERLYKR